MRSKSAAFIEYLADRWVSNEACRSSLEGCSEDDLAQIKQRQQVDRLPALYAAFLSKMGRNMGGLEWQVGSEMRFPYVLEFKESTFVELRQPNILVLTHDSDGDCALYIHTNEDDPVLHWVGYKDEAFPELIHEEFGRLSAWLSHLVESVKEVKGHDTPQNS
jgi:hypothetical protein